MPKAPINFTVKGLAPEHDPTWATATRRQKAAYLRVCRELVLTEWDKQTAAGLDKDGVPLAKLSPKTIKYRRSAMGAADPHAPPLQPAHELSRTRSLVDARIVGTTVQVFWKFDPISGKRWGTILGYHRDGKRHLPHRDVFGLSQEARQRVLQGAFHWWAAFSRGRPVAMPARPRPGKAARPAAAIQPPRERATPMLPTAPPPQPETSRTPANVTIGGDVYTGTKAAAAILLGAVKAGRPIKFRSYE